MAKKNQQQNWEAQQAMELEAPQSKYAKQYQNKGLSGLFSISSKTKPTKIKTDGTGLATIPTADNDVVALIANYSDKKLTQSDLRVLEYALTLLTANLTYNEQSETKLLNSGEISLDINDFMLWRGIKDKKKIRGEVTHFVNTLYDVSIEWTQEVWEVPEGKKRRQKIQHPFRMRILDAQDEKIWQNGKAKFCFALSFVKPYAQYSQIAPTPLAIGKINLQANPNSLALIKKISNHYNMNIGKTNEQIIGVKTLAEYSLNLPNYDDIKGIGGVYQRIIQPFIRDMNHLKTIGAIKEWYFLDFNGERDKEQNHTADYSTFINSKIHFELVPDQLLEELRAKKIKGIQKKAEQKKKREEEEDAKHKKPKKG